jgi:hypothetical protein
MILAFLGPYLKSCTQMQVVDNAMIPQKYTPNYPRHFLLAELALVEGQLFSLQDISINTATLAWSRGNDCIETTSFELFLQSRLNLTLGCKSSSVLLLHSLALLLRLSNLLSCLLLTSSAQALSIMCFIPLTERSGINLNNSRFCEGVCSDEFVVGRMESHDDHTDLSCDTLRTP